MIEMIYFLTIWVILAFIDNGLACYTLKLNKTLFPKKKYTEITEKNNLQALLAKKLGLILGGTIMYISMVIVIFTVVYILYRFFDPLIITIAFGFMLGLDTILILNCHLPEIKRLKLLIRSSKDSNLKEELSQYLVNTEKNFEILKKIKTR